MLMCTLHTWICTRGLEFVLPAANQTLIVALRVQLSGAQRPWRMLLAPGLMRVGMP